MHQDIHHQRADITVTTLHCSGECMILTVHCLNCLFLAASSSWDARQSFEKAAAAEPANQSSNAHTQNPELEPRSTHLRKESPAVCCAHELQHIMCTAKQAECAKLQQTHVPQGTPRDLVPNRLWMPGNAAEAMTRATAPFWE